MLSKLKNKKVLWIVGGLLLVAILGYVGVSGYVASQIVERNYRELTVSAEEISPEYEDISFTTSDGIGLKGWFFPGSSSDKLVVLVAGFGNTRVNDDYNGAGLARELIGEGYSVLMYDARGVGQSEGKYITQADHEWKDARAAIDYAIDQKSYQADKIAIIASSMGAATTADNIDQFADVGAIVLDSTAKEFVSIVAVALEDNGIPSVIHPGAFLLAKWLYGIDIPSVRPLDRIDQAKQELLLLHTVDDELIPIQDSRDLIAKIGTPNKLVEFPLGGHVESYKENPELYRQEVFGYLKQQLEQ